MTAATLSRSVEATLSAFYPAWALHDRQPIDMQVVGRDDLALFFRDLGFTKGAEIGVERGLYSEVLLNANPNLHLRCVDAWAPYPGYREHVTEDKLTGIYEDACQRLAKFYGRVAIVRKFSVEAAVDVPNGSLDFVYIDAAHILPQVIADIAAWAPKVRAGGIVSGHDFGRSSVGHVREAVEAYTKAYRIAPWFVLTGDRSPSWLWVKA